METTGILAALPSLPEVLSSTEYLAGHSFVCVPDEVNELGTHTIVSEVFPDGFSVNTVKCFFIVHTVDVE